MFWLGVAGFALFFLGDYNDLRLKKRALRLCFPTGCLLLTAATVLLCLRHTAPLRGAARILFALAALAALGLLVYSLFFALRVGEAYARPGEKRRACVHGVYALCRHPGVLFFILLYLCLWLALGLPVGYALAYSLFNVALALYEDAVVFPAVLEGYDDYKRTTPFLIPRFRHSK